MDSLLSKITLSMFALVKLDGMLGLRAYFDKSPFISLVPRATHGVRLRAIERFWARSKRPLRLWKWDKPAVRKKREQYPHLFALQTGFFVKNQMDSANDQTWFFGSSKSTGTWTGSSSAPVISMTSSASLFSESLTLAAVSMRVEDSLWPAFLDCDLGLSELDWFFPPWESFKSELVLWHISRPLDDVDWRVSLALKGRFLIWLTMAVCSFSEIVPSPKRALGTYFCIEPGLASNSITICWLFTIKDHWKKIVWFLETRNQSLSQLFLWFLGASAA